MSYSQLVARTKGARNLDYDERRTALARQLSRGLQRGDAVPAALADLAATAGVSTTTLRHYFGDRDGVIAAVLETARLDAAGYIGAGADASGRPPEQSVPDLLLGVVLAWRQHGLDQLLTGALSVGLGSRTRGPAVVTELLEPLLAGTERLLVAHASSGQLPWLDETAARAAALALVAPVLLALLHQDALRGRTVRPLDLEPFVREHAALVLAGLRAQPGAP